DVFITKTDCSGNMIWTKGVGGTSTETGFSIAVDLQGNVYVAGEFDSTTDFDPGPGGVNASPVPGGGPLNGTLNDSFVLKLDGNGNFVWVKPFGGIGNEYALAVAADALSNVYVAGWYNDSTSFNMGPFVVPPTFSMMPTNGSWDIFVAKIDAQGNFAWVKT